MDGLTLLYFLLFIVAFLYSSVGHGGASGYLALMALYNFSPDIMKPSALLLNLFVSLVAFIQFYRGGHLLSKMILPLIVTSIPFSFVGGMIDLEVDIYKRILGIILLVPVLRFLFISDKELNSQNEFNNYILLIIGCIIGFLSGLIGIGGGILLSPILLLLNWTNQKQAAAISALFIFVNSASGLASQFFNEVTFANEIYNYVILALAGGLLGSFFGVKYFNHKVLKYILSLVLLIAAIKLLKI